MPQGSVLEPTHFHVYINDLDEVTHMIEMLRKFADDTKAGQRVGTEEGRAKLQVTLDGLCEWARRWGMQFNIKKCKVMHVGHANTRHVYTMEGQPLESVEEETDIGVRVASTLKPTTQCHKAAQTARTVIGQIARAFHYRDRHVFIKLYNIFVRPHLEFSTVAWAPWTQSDIECLETCRNLPYKWFPA